MQTKKKYPLVLVTLTNEEGDEVCHMGSIEEETQSEIYLRIIKNNKLEIIFKADSSLNIKTLGNEI